MLYGLAAWTFSLVLIALVGVSFFKYAAGTWGLGASFAVAALALTLLRG